MSLDPARTVVVSLHDVSPRTMEPCARQLAEVTALGVSHCSLLVIPNHHGRGHVRESEACCAWLRAVEKDGHEIVTHGYFHQRPRRTAESWKTRLITGTYTAGEGEFFDLGETAARQCVARGNEELRAIGLHPTGFIAPAWLLSDGAEQALRSLGVAYTTRLRTVLNLRSNTTLHTQSLVWSVRNAWRRTVSQLWNAFLFQRLRNEPLLRISLHPVDMAHPAVWKQIQRLIAAALVDRVPRSYREALG